MSSYRARLEADKAKGQQEADTFNARYPIGTPVIAYPSIRPEHPVAVAYRKRVEEGRTFGHADPCKRLETVTRTPAWILGHGEPVVSVEGYAGGICLSHVDIAPRTNTPDQTTVNEDGRPVTTIKMKRACNGCGRAIGDVDNRDVDQHGNLTDVRHECSFCGPVVELERQGWRTWYLTERSLSRIDDEVDRMGVYAKGYWENVDGKLTVTGLRIGADERRVVAHYGDWITHHPRIGWAVHKAVAS